MRENLPDGLDVGEVVGVLEFLLEISKGIRGLGKVCSSLLEGLLIVIARRGAMTVRGG